MGQKRVLLTLVETVHFIHEQYRVAPCGTLLARLADGFAYFPHAGKYRRKLQEVRVGSAGHNTRQGGFTDPRWAPENH